MTRHTAKEYENTKFGFNRGNLKEVVEVTAEDIDDHPFVVTNSHPDKEMFYNWIARTIYDLHESDDYRIDPSECEVSINLFDRWLELAKADGIEQVEFSMLWLNKGPHANENIPENLIALSDQFITRQ